jgi:ABC-2 type transport system permease protein
VRSFWPIYKRELFAYFVTPLAWVLIAIFLFTQGMHFFLLVDEFASAAADVTGDETPLSAFFGNTVLLYIVLFVLIPPMTMRLFAEERRSGAIEALMTAPVSSAAVVLAKYAAALTTYTAMWLPTLLYVVIMRRADPGGQLDWHAAASAYLGVLLVGAGYLAVGLCASALTSSQFLAMVMTALVLLSLFILGIGEFVAREGTTMHDLSAYVSAWAHMNDFANGLVDSRRVVFYGSMIALSLFGATRAVDSWRWG